MALGVAPNVPTKYRMNKLGSFYIIEEKKLAGGILPYWSEINETLQNSEYNSIKALKRKLLRDTETSKYPRTIYVRELSNTPPLEDE